MSKKPIIVFEGVEGTGKSYHIKKVVNYLKRKKLNRYDKFENSFYNKVQDGFLKLFKANPSRYMKIDSNKNIILNETKILDKIKKLI